MTNDKTAVNLFKINLYIEQTALQILDEMDFAQFFVINNNRICDDHIQQRFIYRGLTIWLDFKD